MTLVSRFGPVAAAVAAATGLLVGCSGSGHKVHALPTTIGGAPGVKGAPDAYPTYPVNPPAALAALGVAKGRAIRIRSGYDPTDIDVAPTGVLASIPLFGKASQKNGVAQQALVDPYSGKIARITPVHKGWSTVGAALAQNGTVVWTETQSGPTCADQSYGCFSWAVYEASRIGATPHLLAQQEQAVPLRGVPSQVRIVGSTVCWAASADEKSWSLARVPLTPGASQEVTQVSSWVSDCVADGNETVLNTSTGFQGSGFAVPNVVAIDSSGTQTVIADHSENAAALGDQVAYVRIADPNAGRRQVWVTSLTNPKPRKLLDQGDVYRVNWLDANHVLADTDTGLLLIDVRTGTNSVVVPSSQVGLLARTGDGRLVLGRHLANSDTEVDVFALPKTSS
jgi:hypothetical protein